MKSGHEWKVADEPGLRIWLIALAVLMALTWPVLSSEGWAEWDDHERALKVLSWVINAILSCFILRIAVIRKMGFIGMLRLFPWLTLAIFATVAGLTFAFGPVNPVSLTRVAFAGIHCAAWFAFLRRYPGILAS